MVIIFKTLLHTKLKTSFKIISATPESVIEDNICEEVPSESKAAESTSIGRCKTSFLQRKYSISA